MRKKNHLCPFCLREFDRVPFLCMNRKCSFCKERRFLYTKFGLFKTANNVKCPYCGDASYHAVCPNCLRPYSKNEPKFIVPILGNLCSGKSTYCGVLIHEMINRIAPSFNGSFEGVGDSYLRYECYYKNLYSGMSVMSTPPVRNGINLPMVFDYKRRVKRKNSFDISTTAIYDFTLENMMLTYEELDEELDFESELFANASGLILVIDPLSFKRIVDFVKTKTNINRNIACGVYKGEDDNVFEMICNISTKMRKTAKIEEYKKIQIPVAVVISKYDIFEDLVPEGSILRKKSPHCKEGKIDDIDIRSVHEEVAALLNEWNHRLAKEIELLLETNFKTHSYFAVSSLGTGNSSKECGIFEIPHLHRIEDPMLWLMKENMIIK